MRIAKRFACVLTSILSLTLNSRASAAAGEPDLGPVVRTLHRCERALGALERKISVIGSVPLAGVIDHAVIWSGTYLGQRLDFARADRADRPEFRVFYNQGVATRVRDWRLKILARPETWLGRRLAEKMTASLRHESLAHLLAPEGTDVLALDHGVYLYRHGRRTRSYFGGGQVVVLKEGLVIDAVKFRDVPGAEWSRR